MSDNAAMQMRRVLALLKSGRSEGAEVFLEYIMKHGNWPKVVFDEGDDGLISAIRMIEIIKGDKPKQRRHELKCWPQFFRVLLDGTKTFDVRKDDRDFRVGDLITFKEYDPLDDDFVEGGQVAGYSGRSVDLKIVYIFRGEDCPGMWLLQQNVVVLGLGA